MVYGGDFFTNMIKKERTLKLPIGFLIFAIQTTVYDH